MFTGLIEEIGYLENIKQKSNLFVLTVKAGKIIKGLNEGDSICVNGVCLTIISVNKDNFSADVMKETAKKTNLKNIKPKDKINLEKALSVSSLLGGHIVTGHIDGTGVVKSIKKGSNLFNVEIEAGLDIMIYLVDKGSIAVNGVSLTVGKTNENSFWIYLIPKTLEKTNLMDLKIGDEVNLESDTIGKYVYRFTEKYQTKSKIDYNLLLKTGFVKGAN